MTFGALTLALVALWAPRLSASPRLARVWTYPFAVAVAAALAAGIVDVRGILVMLFYAVACRAANRAVGTRLRLTAHVLLVLLCGGLMLHVFPGFDNPRVLSDVIVSPDGVPYTKYLNFDKAVAGLFLLGIYAPQLVEHDPGLRRAGAFAWRFAALTGAVIALSLAIGYLRWDPKLPFWFPFWGWSMLFFTALPEEALFRGFAQTALEARLGTAAAIAMASALFGIAHAAGGAEYVLLATVAGVGYGWIYAATRSLAAAILAHAALNAVHFLFFTYPALA